MGQSILSSQLLGPAVTRQWMKPVTFTSSMIQAFGMAWEIFRVPDLTDHVFQLYSKAGDILAHSSYIILSRDYNVGYVVLTSGNETTPTTEQLTSTVAAHLFPALAKAARQQAENKYAGTYTSADEVLNSTLTISTEAKNPGLVVSGWITKGTSIDVPMSAIFGVPTGFDIRLYPTGPVETASPTRERVGYKAAIDVTSKET